MASTSRTYEPSSMHRRNTHSSTTGVKKDHEFAHRNRGIYTFRVQGQVYHFINDILPTEERPRYIQLYFYDTDHEMMHRLQISSDFQRRVIDILMHIMDSNPYAKFFRSLRTLEVSEATRIVIRADPMHDQRTHNAPTTSQIAAIWVEDDITPQPLRHDILVYACSGQPHQGVIDSYNAGETNVSNIGHSYILPAGFIGCDRDLRCRYLNSMGLVQRYGKPDIFLTITCNPRWPEIERELMPFEEAQNRSDLPARIFRAKLMEVKKEIVEKKLFGEVAGYIYVVEFQKRGLPHAHFLIILNSNSRIRTPEQYDDYVCAEIPDASENSHLHAAVVKHMMHGPCGLDFPNNPCIKNSTCKNHYPRDFS
ncbi:uncharacterized protein LOC141651949 [Silene latifolia]|uniref:uncharacterized protein LOC141651949 n=1 Tax=Silene latifolia TaxID=37657 RepID=UPI003D775E4C